MGASVVLAFALTGCDATEDDADPAGSGSGGQSSVTLVDAGEAPRKKLRLVVKEGTRTRGSMTTAMSVAQSMVGEKSPPIAMPAVTMGMLVEATDVAGDGTFDSKFSFDGVDAAGDDAQAHQIEQAMSWSWT